MNEILRIAAVRLIAAIFLFTFALNLVLAESKFEKTKRLAEQGNVNGQAWQCYMYRMGKGVEQNYSMALKWCRKAASQGNATSQSTLGKMYYHGIGIPKDYTEAARWLRKSANQANASAQNTLGVMYLKGEGIPRDRAEGLKWVKSAADLGDTDAIRNYDIIQQGGEPIEPHNGEEIRLKKNRGVYEVPVELNGVLKINMILDSGASVVSLSRDVALTLIRTGTIEDSDWLGSAHYTFADGTTAKSNRFRLRTLKLGSRTFRNVTCAIAKSLKAPMLLGQNVLSKLGKYTFDYSREVLIIE